jgi:hypothetical protein
MGQAQSTTSVTTSAPSAPTPNVPNKPKRMYLDVQVSSEPLPQLLSISALLCDGDGEKLNGFSKIVVPRRGYGYLQHLQDIRYHGLTSHMLATRGQPSAKAIHRFLEFVSNDDDVIIVGHAVDAMLSNFLTAAKLDETLQPYMDSLEALCRRETVDLLPKSVNQWPYMDDYTVERILAALGEPLPIDRASALAVLDANLRAASA